MSLFASSGGAVTALEFGGGLPGRRRQALVAHEPPLIDVLPDRTRRAQGPRRVHERLSGQGLGRGHGREFMQLGSWLGEFTDEYFALAAARSSAVRDAGRGRRQARRPVARGTPRSPSPTTTRGVQELAAAPTRVVIAVGEETVDVFTGRTAIHTARLLGQEATVFPSHHGGFLGGEFGYAGKPEEFGVRLREVLDDG